MKTRLLLTLMPILAVSCIDTPDTLSGTIIFVSDRAGNQDIWSMNADGSNVRQLTTHPGLDAQPAPSADGRYIAFISDAECPATGPDELPNTGVWVMNMDGTDPRRLTPPDGEFEEAYCFQPAWSPDGISVVFARTKGSETLYIVPADGSADPVALETGVGRYNPEFSPSGLDLIYDYDSGGTGWWHLYLREMPDGIETPLATANHSVAGAYSHIGDRIAYIHAWRPISQVRIMNWDGSNDHLVIDNAAIAYDGWGQVAWSPDDSLLAVSVYNSLYPGVPEFDNFIQLVDVDTGLELYRTTTAGRNMFVYESSLYADRHYVAANRVWSSDGSHLVFMSNRDGNWEIYCMNSDGTGEINLSQNEAWDGNPVWVD